MSTRRFTTTVVGFGALAASLMVLPGVLRRWSVDRPTAPVPREASARPTGVRRTASPASRCDVKDETPGDPNPEVFTRHGRHDHLSLTSQEDEGEFFEVTVTSTGTVVIDGIVVKAGQTDADRTQRPAIRHPDGAGHLPRHGLLRPDATVGAAADRRRPRRRSRRRRPRRRSQRRPRRASRRPRRSPRPPPRPPRRPPRPPRPPPRPLRRPPRLPRRRRPPPTSRRPRRRRRRVPPPRRSCRRRTPARCRTPVAAEART